MSLFDQLVDEALKSRADLATLRPVVEEELLHHDIMRELSEAGLLAGLTFIGGTCLRACYGSTRLSEDLDFTGGNDFNRRDLWDIGWLVQQGVELPTRLVPLKVRDHQREDVEFVELLRSRVQGLKSLPEMRDDFLKEMRRFLPAATVRDTVEKQGYWQYLTQVIDEQASLAIAGLG